jgi:hypothetical protein
MRLYIPTPTEILALLVAILIIAFAAFLLCGCSAIQTTVKGERTANGFWVKQTGPGSTEVTETLPDGTTRTIKTERPQVLRLWTPETIGAAAPLFLDGD